MPRCNVKQTRKRIENATLKHERDRVLEMWARLGGAELLKEHLGNRKPLTHRPFAALLTRS
jgi:hypothetical protein